MENGGTQKGDEHMSSETMTGRMIDANFEANTLTFEMYRGYYAATGKYVIVRESDYLSETEQRAELLEALNRAFDLIASIGYPANTSGRYNKSGKWTFDEAIPDHTNASAIESAFDVIAEAIAHATQQRNATGGEG